MFQTSHLKLEIITNDPKENFNKRNRSNKFEIEVSLNYSKWKHYIMASRAIREVQALNIVAQELSNEIGVEKLNYASIETLEDLDKIEAEQPWVLRQVNILLIFLFNSHIVILTWTSIWFNIQILISATCLQKRSTHQTSSKKWSHYCEL